MAKTKHAEYDPGIELIRIHFPYSPAMIALVKTLHGRELQKEPQFHWSVPYTEQTIRQLREWGFEFGPELETLVGRSKYRSIEKIARKLDFSGLPYQPHDFQRYGVAYIISRNGCAYLGDQMRVGKSVQSILYAHVEKKKRPVLVIPTANIKETWRREILKWLPDARICVVEGRYDGHVLPKADFYIANYDIIADVTRKKCGACKGKGEIKWVDEFRHCITCDGSGKGKKAEVKFRRDLLDVRPQIAVIDEAHRIANPKTQRTRAVMLLKKRVPHRIALSGTPFKDRPMQLFSALNWVAPEVFPSYWSYAKEFCGAVKDKFSGAWDFSGNINTEGLHQLLKDTIFLRRTRQEVMPGVAEPEPVVVPMPLTSRANYEKAKHGIVMELRYMFGDEEWEVNTKSRNIVEKLKQVAVAEKLAHAIDWLWDVLQQEDKVIVYATHQKTVDILMDELAEFEPVAVDGRVTQRNRNAAIDTFMTDPACKLFVGNMVAASEGLDFSVCDIACFIELGWSPHDHDQASARIVNLDKKGGDMVAYYLVAEGTIEEDIAALLDDKRKVLAQVLDGKDVETGDLLMELLAKLRR